MNRDKTPIFWLHCERCMNSSFAPQADCVLYVVSQWVEINSEGTLLYLLAFSLELIPVKIPTWKKLIDIREFGLRLVVSGRKTTGKLVFRFFNWSFLCTKNEDGRR